MMNQYKTNVKNWIYRSLYIPLKSFQIRHKRNISVAFIISEVGVWKTEALYLLMKEHPRFTPHLVVVPSTELDTKRDVESFLNDRGYEFVYVDKEKRIQEKIKVDIMFYQKNTHFHYCEKHQFSKKTNCLNCYVYYAFHSVIEKWALSQPLIENAWQVYYENAPTAIEASSHMNNEGKNFIVTGLPIMDELLKDKSSYENPWKPQPCEKKRVIWAPHHTLPKGRNWLNYSTFLDYADFMLELAIKYKERVQFAFKPHPLLEKRLTELWGAERTKAYYAKWSSLENAQYEKGKYIDLFKHSDAMIHDCGSFTIEYHYTQNPVMYLTNGTDHERNLANFAKKAYQLHYMGRCKEDIEHFIQFVVLEGNDPLKEMRASYLQEYLIPPRGKTASQNIIDAILGK